MQGLIVDFAQFAAMIAKLADKARNCIHMVTSLVVEKRLLFSSPIFF